MKSQLTDAQLQALRRRMLIAMTKHPDPALAECAREVLRGRLTLNQAVTGSAYAEKFAAGTERWVRAWERMPEAERTALAEQFEGRIEEILAEPEPEIDAEPAKPVANRQRPEPIVDEPLGPIMTTPEPARGWHEGPASRPQRQTWRRRF
jgi:hypothetical protein